MPDMDQRRLAWTLALAVPLEIDQLRTVDDELRAHQIDAIIRRNQYPNNSVAMYSDDLMYGGLAVATRFAELVRVLACLAWQDGGVTVAGMHFCARHELCEKADAEQGGPLL